jgi:hypothetical protein
MREVGGSSPSSPIGLNHPAGWRRVAESVSEWSLPGWLGTEMESAKRLHPGAWMQPLRLSVILIEYRKQLGR